MEITVSGTIRPLPDFAWPGKHEDAVLHDHDPCWFDTSNYGILTLEVSTRFYSKRATRSSWLKNNT